MHFGNTGMMPPASPYLKGAEYILSLSRSQLQDRTWTWVVTLGLCAAPRVFKM